MIRNNVALAERVARATPHVLAEGRELKRYILGATPQDGCQVPKKNNKITEEEEEGMLRRHSERLSEEKAATSARARTPPRKLQKQTRLSEKTLFLLLQLFFNGFSGRWCDVGRRLFPTLVHKRPTIVMNDPHSDFASDPSRRGERRVPPPSLEELKEKKQGDLQLSCEG